MGSRAQKAAQVLLLASQIDAALVLLLFSAYFNAYCVPRCVESLARVTKSYLLALGKPKSRRQFRSRMLIENGAPFSVGGRPENENIQKLAEKNTSFGSIGLMIDFAA